ncbi:hypothetical protein PAESOLCIP111_02006 [Paenibacillus solanacearum]|uniref:Uncharacterized protein n=1 Tax=Paenibacillus solanacearum TaxID=2048548 RepID=A0A916JZF9_9BACL|nr:hypothetical protein [Paenibacillus solanacearum]CAG7617289.1 hypothetical protein PAESOLCIP111_02006 [Paenibacillus solanacearum]
MKTKQPAMHELAAVQLLHETMEARIGYPAVVAPGETYPSLAVTSKRAGTVSVNVFHEESGERIAVAAEQPLQAGEVAVIRVPGTAYKSGVCCMKAELRLDGLPPEIDCYYFTAVEGLPPNSSKAAYVNERGRMTYLPDYRGNRLPDFSGVGYSGGGVAIPDVPVMATLEPAPGDNTGRIQEAIDRVSGLPLDDRGIRGAVLLRKGVYEIAGSIEVKASGVVLRGEGQGDVRKLWYDPDQRYDLARLQEALAGTEATVLLATGSVRRRVLKIHGSEQSVRVPASDSSEILDSYVPAGANAFRVEHPERFRVGDTIIVQRSGNADWIGEIGMDRIPPRDDGGKITQWSPFGLEFEHVVTAIEQDRITVDSSLMNAVDKRWGGGRIYKFEDPGRISQVGVESLRAIAYWQPNEDGVDDTRHADEFVDLDYCKNGWVRNVTLEHFNSTNGAFRTGRGSKWITIQDSSNLIADRKYYNGKGYDPTGRTFYETNIYVGRYGFYLIGQSGLVQRCFALNNRHGFTLGSRVTGPNVFLDCIGEQPLTWSEPHHRWSVGGLYDNVHDMISLMNRLNMGSGHGWAGANYVAWNTEGTLVAHQPPTAQNWAIGHIGKKDPGGNRGPDGFWDSHGQHVEPRSLYVQQLKDRLGEEALRSTGY